MNLSDSGSTYYLHCSCVLFPTFSINTAFGSCHCLKETGLEEALAKSVSTEVISPSLDVPGQSNVEHGGLLILPSSPKIREDMVCGLLTLSAHHVFRNFSVFLT
jgi:hypothetical protein